ncbi:MAG: hypothetical protein ABI398_03905 [Devosia sp.]
MSDQADKSDDLIAELAKLMAVPPRGAAPAIQPIAKPAPIDPAATAPSAPAAAPTSFRIPGMDAPAPRPVAPAPQAEAPSGPATGSIRIPGMDQPAAVSTSAPVSKFDFGRPVAPAPINQEPLSSLSERLAAQSRSPAPAPAVRIPSSLTPVSENRSFAEGPALSVTKPAPAPISSYVAPPAAPIPMPSAPPPQQSGGNDFNFDFGFGANPPASASLSRPRSPDPIADLIAADIASAPQSEPEAQDDEPEADYDEEPEAAFHDEPEQQAPEPEAPRAGPVPVASIIRTMVTPQTQAPRPVIASVPQGVPRAASSAPIPLKPISVAPRSADNDRFAISPGVGLNMKQSANQPLSSPQQRAPEPTHFDRDQSDPMSEIENLIGEAVRVELSPGPVRVQVAQSVAPNVEFEDEEDVEREIAQHQQSPAPIVPPLTTQFAPRRANLKDDNGARSAEDAILAAAAASGAEVGRVDPTIGDESPYRRLKVKPQRSSFLSGGMRQYIGMAVAGTLLLAAGLGLYWVLNMGRTANTGATAPQLTADSTPVKVKPAATTAPTTDAAKSPVLARMDGASQAPSTEQLVATDQPNATDVTRDVTPAADDTDSGLANRKVRTVTVRPDGTIVSGDDAVAGAEELPVARPNVPTVPSTEATNLLGNSDAGTASDPLLPLTDDTQVATADPAPMAPVDPSVVAPVPMQFPVRTAAAKTQATTPTNPVNAVVGAQTPTGQIDLLGSNDLAPPKQVAALKPTAPVANDGGNAAAYVQLSSQPTQGDAAASIKTMTARYGALFGGQKLTVQQVDLGQKGIRFRVRLPMSSLSDAASVCAQIKAQGGDCFATNG